MFRLSMRKLMSRRIQISPWRAAALLTLAACSAHCCAPRMRRAAGAADVDAVVSQSRAAKSGDDFLPPEQAFRLSASADGAERVRLTWVIAPGYYLYRDRIKAAGADGQAHGRRAGVPCQGRSNPTSTSASRWSITMSCWSRCRSSAAARDRQLSLNVTYQGCAEAGLCYPPVTRTLSVALPGASDGTGGGAPAGGATGTAVAARCVQRLRLGAGPPGGAAPQRQPAGGAAAVLRRRACCWRSRRACCRWCRFSPA